MQTVDTRTQWEGAAPGWARWEATIATWMEPATEAMLTMAGVNVSARVLDLASGAGSQTLQAARRVGSHGHVVASDIADTMLYHVRENARAAGLTNVMTLAGAAEDLDVAAESFDAVICRLGLMLFVEPARALAAVRRALRPNGVYVTLGGTTASILGSILVGPLISRFSDRWSGLLLWWKPFHAPDVATVTDLIAAGQVTPVIDRRYPLREVVDALRWVDDGHARGKVILTVGGDESA